MKVAVDKLNTFTMVDVDQKIISHFLCTHRLDSTQVDVESPLMEVDLIFFPVKDEESSMQFHTVNKERYLSRIKVLFNPDLSAN